MGFIKKFLRNLSILIALVATAIGLVGKHAPHLFMKLPMGFIPWAITGHFVPPYFDNTMWLDSGLREWVRDGDVVVAVGAKSGTTWMCYCADAIRRKGVTEGNGLLPYRDIMYTTPWLEASQKPGETWAERAAFYESHVFEDGSRLKDYWDNEKYPFRVFKSHFGPDSVAGDPYANVLPVLTYPKVKYVALVRNGRDMARSWYFFVDRHRDEFRQEWGSFPPAYPSIDAAMADLMPGGNCYGLYFPYVHAWWALKEAPNVLLMHYTDAVKGGAKTIKQLADFYGVKLNKAEADTVGEMCSKEHMTANEHVFDYRLPLNPGPGGQFMKSNSFINKVDPATAQPSAATLEAWDAACVAEFPDVKMRTWAAHGGPF